MTPLLTSPVVLLLAVSTCILFSGCSTKGLSKDVRISVTPFFSKGELNTYYMPVGSTINVTCAVTSSEYDVTNLILDLGNEDTVTVNTSSVSLSRKLTEAYSPFWSCCVNQTECSIFESPKQEVATIYIGYPPSRVEDFTCYSMSLTNLVCAWTVHPANSTGVNWNMEYGIFDRAGDDEEAHCRNTTCTCRPQVNGTTYTCTVSPEQFMEMENYSITVSGRNEYGISMYNTSVYSGIGIATFPKLQNLTVRNGTTWIYVTWQAADTGFLPRSATYRVAVFGTRPSMTFLTNNTSYNVTGLHPYSVCTVRVRTRPYTDTNYTRQSVWSQPVFITVRTEEDKPSSPPLLISNGFNWWSRDTESRLTVYWKPVPIEHRNGIVTDYQLCYRTGYGNDTRVVKDEGCPSSWRHVPGNLFSYTWSAIYPLSPCHVTIQAGTKIGHSEPNTLVIPSADIAARHHVEYVTAERISSSVYNISWVTSQLDAQNVTLTWVFGSNPDDAVYFDWKQFPSGSLYALVTPTTPKQQTPEDTVLWFGVALSSNNWTSGITWNQCIFGKGEATQVPILNLRSTEHELLVTFQFSYCDSGLMKSRPLAYSVLYNRQADNTMCDRIACTRGQNKTIPATHNTTNVTIGNLQQNVHYCVCMRIVYRHGLGPTSVPVSVRLKDPLVAPSNATAKIVGGVVGVLAVVIVITGLTYCRKKLRMKYVIDSSLMEKMENDIHEFINPINTEETVPKVSESADSDETPVKTPAEITPTTDVRNATINISNITVSNISVRTVSNTPDSTGRDETCVKAPVEVSPITDGRNATCIASNTSVPAFSTFADSTGSNQTSLKVPLEVRNGSRSVLADEITIPIAQNIDDRADSDVRHGKAPVVATTITQANNSPCPRGPKNNTRLGHGTTPNAILNTCSRHSETAHCEQDCAHSSSAVSVASHGNPVHHLQNNLSSISLSPGNALQTRPLTDQYPMNITSDSSLNNTGSFSSDSYVTVVGAPETSGVTSANVSNEYISSYTQLSLVHSDMDGSNARRLVETSPDVNSNFSTLYSRLTLSQGEADGNINETLTPADSIVANRCVSMSLCSGSRVTNNNCSVTNYVRYDEMVASSSVIMLSSLVGTRTHPEMSSPSVNSSDYTKVTTDV